MRSTPGLALLAGVLSLAACSDGPADPAPSGLTAVEAVQLAARIGAVSADALGIPDASGSTRTASLSRAGAEPLRVPLDVEAPCPLGGIVAIEGTAEFEADEATQSGSLATEATLEHRGCAMYLEEGRVTVDGAPNLSVASAFSWSEGEPAQPLRATHSGAIAWTRPDGTSGTCDVSLVAATDLVQHAQTLEGTVCGHAVDSQVSWTGD